MNLMLQNIVLISGILWKHFEPDGFEADIISGQQRTFIKNENISIVTEQVIEELDGLCNS